MAETTADASDEQAIPKPEGRTHMIQTDYEIGQDNIDSKIGPFGFDIHNPVFLVSGVAIVLFVVLTMIFQSSAEPIFTGMRDWLTATLDWFFLSVANVFVLLCLALIVLPLGKVRIGGPDAVPDFSYTAWFAMLFAAGMGIGLMFFGVSEPLSHYSSAVGGVTMEGGARSDSAPLGAAGDQTEAAARLGMAATIFHWGLHPWAIYAVVGLALALFSFNKGLPLTVRSIFYPIFGEKVWGWPGHIIDIVAVLATLFGLATSLGYGAQQATAGLNYVFGVPGGNLTMVLLICAITGVATLSVLAGLDGGVRRLSEINMVLAVALLAFVIFVGPTVVILGGFFQNLLAYGENLPALSNPFGREDDGFRQGWTAFYWAWWISWSPFVGMFIARVSRGRSVREFVTCVLIIPTLVSVLWMSAFGGTAIHQVVADGRTALQDAALELKLFEMLSAMPLAQVTSLIGITLVIVFFVTSSDSGSLVIDIITAGGKVNAPVPQRVFWCLFEGLVAIALLLGGGLAALQAMAVSAGFPFAALLLVACFAIVKGLMSEKKVMDARRKTAPAE